MKTATVHTLSRTLDLLVLPDGSAQFLRHDRVFRIGASERRNLERVILEQAGVGAIKDGA